MPPLGRRVAVGRIKPQWFNVIRIHNDSDPYQNSTDVLAVLSPQRPDDGNEFFVPLYPHSEGKRPAIQVNPPLPGGTRLYVRTDLRFLVSREDSRNWRPPDGNIYSLSFEDADQLKSYIEDDFLEDCRRRRNQRKQLYGTGGDDILLEGWDSYSEPFSENISKMLDRYFKFEFQPMTSGDLTEPVDPGAVREERDIIRR